MTAPTDAQEFDNTANGGGAKDIFVIYELVQGLKNWPLSPGFVSADSGCSIKYSLVNKGTDTDATTDWTELSLVDG